MSPMNTKTQWQPNREELAWAAGFFDGEGCTWSGIRLRKDRKWTQRHLAASIGQARLEGRNLLERFQKAVNGVGAISGPFRQRQLNRQEFWQWRVNTFEEVQAVVAMLWIFLGNIKRRQAQIALRSYRDFVREAI